MAKAYNIPDDALAGTIYDADNPDSLINIIPDRMVPVLQRIRKKMARVLHCTEGELRKNIHPDERDERVRLAFWDEYNYATKVGKKMSVAAFLQGVMSWEAWITVYEPSDRKMMWVFCPPVSYQVSMRNILYLGQKRLEEIMKSKIHDEEGNLIIPAATLILKTFQLVDIRVKGAITQKLQIQQQSMNVNHNINQDSPHLISGQPIESLQLEDLEKLEKRIESARKHSKRIIGELPEAERKEYLKEDMASVVNGDQSRPLEIEDLDADITLDMSKL